MVKIINPFSGQDPMAAMFARLGGQLTGQKESALSLAKAHEAQRQNTEVEGLAADIAAGRIDPKDPRIAARLLLSGYDPSNYSVLGGMTADPHSDMATRLLSATGHYGQTANIVDQNIAIAKEQEAAKQAQESMDRRYGVDTGAQVARDNAALAQQNEMIQFAQKPMPAMVNAPAGPPVAGPGGAPIAAGAPGAPHPGFVPQGELATRPDVAPILSETDVKGSLGAANFGSMGALPPNEQSYLGADVKAATGGATWMYVAGGKSFMVNDASIAAGKDVQGNPVPPGGSKVSLQPTDAGGAGLGAPAKGNLEKSETSHVLFNTLLDYAEQQVNGSPDINFGLSGIMKGYAQDAVLLAQNLAKGVGFTAPEQAIEAIRSGGLNPVTGLPDQISPEVRQSLLTFDPRLGALATTYTVLIYSAASALAGQENRSVSDTDVKKVQGAVGDPYSIFSSKPLMLAKLKTLRELNEREYAVVKQRLYGTQTGVAPAAPGAPAAPTTYKHTATGQDGRKAGSNDGKTWFDVQTGQPVQ